MTLTTHTNDEAQIVERTPEVETPEPVAPVVDTSPGPRPPTISVKRPGFWARRRIARQKRIDAYVARVSQPSGVRHQHEPQRRPAAAARYAATVRMTSQTGLR